jgi:hypothetical protein
MTTFGFNGHSLDVVCDLVGGLLVSFGILVLMMRRQVIISRIPFLVLSTCGYGKFIARNRLLVSKLIAFFGLLLPAVVGGIWEMFMLRYSNLFDVHAGSNRDLFILDQSQHLRVNQFLWSITCADFMFQVFLVGVFFDRLWGVLQVYAFCGYPWLLLLTVHSFYVWNFVVLSSSAAAGFLVKAT